MESEDGLEEGEIVDYTPLERPPLLLEKPCINGGSQVTGSGDHATTWDDDDDEQSPFSSESEEDSDSDNAASAFRPKRVKRSRQKIVKFAAERQARKKYSVWSDGLQEEALSETLMVNCDVDKIDRSRNVESYDYQMKYRLGSEQNDVKQTGDCEEEDIASKDDHPRNNKRRHWECNSMTKQRWNRRNSEDRNDYKGTVCRTILDLEVTETDSPEDVSKDICNKLCEKKDELIQRVVGVLGIPKAIELYNETKKIEEDGGMMVMNGSRRRTPGGVYLVLVKKDGDTTQEMMKQIFMEDKLMTQQFRKRTKEHNQKLRNSKTNEIKKSIIEDRLLPNLLTRPELELASRLRTGGSGGTETGGDPPPSPASTFDFDAGGDSTAHHPPTMVATYGDDFLQLNVDDNMEVF